MRNAFVNSPIERTITVLIVVACLLIAGATFADPTTPAENNPATNPDANACYAGGSYENRCLVDLDLDGTIEDWEIDAMWEAGWYRIRLEYGMISPNQVPPQYSFILPEVLQATIVRVDCQLTLGGFAGQNATVNPITIPLSVLTGGEDPDFSFSAYDWSGGYLYVSDNGNLARLTDGGSTWLSANVASTDCPLPQPPVP
jgi:hypothetical protein